jgi:hypothetical protein
MVDSGDKSFHPLAAPPDAKPSGKYDNQYVTNADGTRRLVGMVDTGDKHFIPVSADPTTQKKTIQTPNAVYSVDDNDNVNKLFDIDKSVPLQAVVIDGTVYSFDPNEKDPTKRLVQVSANNLPQTIKQGDVTYVLQKNDDGTFEYKLPPGVDKPAALQTNTTAKTLDWYDANGNLIKSVQNRNYVEPKVDQPNLPATNTVAPNILVPDPDKPGSFKWIPNEARVTASQALQNLASSLSGHVVDGKISVDEAKTIIDGANTAMQTATTAATQALDYTSRGAQAGAGLLQQRAATAQGVLSDVMRTATQRPLYAGAPDLSGLSSAIGNWTAGLMGGQDTLNAAASMVRAASPDGNSPMAAAATSALTQMLNKYKELNGGQPHPIELTHQAAQQSVANGGVAAPLTTPPVVQQPAAAAQPVTFTAPNQVAANMAPANQVPGQNYGATTAYSGGIAPWNAQPGPSFVAPVAPSPLVAPPTPTVTIHVGG